MIDKGFLYFYAPWRMIADTHLEFSRVNIFYNPRKKLYATAWGFSFYAPIVV